MNCQALHDLTVDYLNVVAQEYQAKSAESKAFTQLQMESARALVRRMADARESARRTLVEHCREHGCCPDVERDLDGATELLSTH